MQYVDEVIIGAPYSVTEDILNKEYTVHVVAHSNTEIEPDLDGRDPYEVTMNLMTLSCYNFYNICFINKQMFINFNLVTKTTRNLSSH